jgi:hypothetical protein
MMRKRLLLFGVMAIVLVLLGSGSPAYADTIYLYGGCHTWQFAPGHYGRLCSWVDFDGTTGQVRGHARDYCFTAAGNERCGWIKGNPGASSEARDYPIVYLKRTDLPDAPIGWASVSICGSEIGWPACPVDGKSWVTGWHPVACLLTYGAANWSQVGEHGGYSTPGNWVEWHTKRIC